MQTPRIAPGFAPLFVATLAALSAVCAPARAGEDATTVAAQSSPVVAVVSDPCGFFRGQAYGRGITHFATEMLWACEEIAARRSVHMALSERLTAVDLALERYRAAVVEAGAAGHVQGRSSVHAFGPGETAKRRIADETGMMAALEAIRTGF